MPPPMMRGAPAQISHIVDLITGGARAAGNCSCPGQGAALLCRPVEPGLDPLNAPMAGYAASGPSDRCNGYRFAKCHGKPNSANARKPAWHRYFCNSVIAGAGSAFTLHSSRYLNCPSNLIGHDHPNKPANGEGLAGRFNSGQEPRSGEGGQQSKRGCQMFQGQIDLDTAIPVQATAIPDVLFERGLYWASGRSGVVNLVAAHKWFNLAALKGRTEAIELRREVAELMSEVEIATAQREARAWITAH